MNDAESALTRSSIRTLLDEAPADFLGALATRGWAQLAQDDPASAYSILFEEHGRALTAADVLDAAGLWALPDWDRRPLTVLPASIDADRPRSTLLEGGGRVEVDGLVFAAPTRDCTLLVPCATPDGHLVVVVDGAQIQSTPVQGMDPEWRLHAVCAEVPVVERAPIEWAMLVAHFRIALAFTLLGCAHAMLELGLSHVRTREQFGRPVGSFQAVKHRLADVHVELALARLVAQEAAANVGVGSARLARAAAGRAAELAARDVQQCLGAMGFTDEHSFSRYGRRATMLQVLLGTTPAVLREIGVAVAERGRAERFGVL